ncbi:MAG: type II secretion system F family protein [Planctomycetota bacterium]|nr:type II secretion system F family protein [Planctomycetota bacterium]
MLIDYLPLAEHNLLIRGGATLATAVAVFAGFISLRFPMGRIIRKHETRFHEALVELFMFDVTPRQLTYGMFLAAGVVGLLLGLMVWDAGAGQLGIVIMFAAGVAVGWWVPRVVIFVLQRRRRDRLNDQLIDGLVTLANGMRAGLNLVQSMRLIEDNTEPPISQEFGLMLREFEHGASVDEVMRRASLRIKLHHYRLLFAAMQTARVRGGNLPDTLDRLGESLREIVRLEEKVRALTAQNKLSAIMMGCMPAAILGVYYLIEPTWVATLFSRDNDWGLLLLAIAVLLNVAGFLWIRKIVTFEI